MADTGARDRFGLPMLAFLPPGCVSMVDSLPLCSNRIGFQFHAIPALLISIAIAGVTCDVASAQVRIKTVDRGVYQPPTTSPVGDADQVDATESLQPPIILRVPTGPAPLRDPDSQPDTDDEITPVAFQNVVTPDGSVVGPTPLAEAAIDASPRYMTGPLVEDGPWIDGGVMMDGYIGCDDCEGACDACPPACGPCYSNARLSSGHENWFGRLEVLLMFREGDIIPALVATGTETDPRETILAGDEKIFDSMTAGGRVTIGTWLDDCHIRSLVFRAWSATEDDYDRSFGSDIEILSIPFSDLAGTEQSNLLTFPNGVG
ncbi:MAG: BBP7 family outer membrane beta-barrel protein, partial [Planctomycetota bacterium]